MEQTTEKALREYLENQGINQAKIDWIIAFLKCWIRKTTGLIAQEMFKLLEIGEANGTKDDQPKYFKFGMSGKGYFDNLQVCKAEFGLTYTESHKRSDGVMVEIEGGQLLEQGSLFHDGAGADFTIGEPDDDYPENNDDEPEPSDEPDNVTQFEKNKAVVEEPVEQAKPESAKPPARKNARKNAKKK